MSRDDRFNLLMEMKRKSIKLKDAAKHLECSSSLLSLYFNDKCNMDEQKVIKLKQFVDDQKEFKTIRVIVH